MSNIAGKASSINVITPMKPKWTWVNNFLFMFSRAMPSTLRRLLGLSIIHFARWVIIRRDQWPDMGDPDAKQNLNNDYMLFCSNFNGTWDQYIDAFSDGVPDGLDVLWYSSTKYPHSIPITAFKNYICHNQVETDYYYNATPGAGQRDIKSAMRVRDGMMALEAAHKKMSPAEFKRAFNKQLTVLQNSLPSQGFAPVASPDTETANKNRIEFIEFRNQMLRASGADPVA